MENSDIEYLKKNYASLGAIECAKILGVEIGKIKYQCQKYNLRITAATKSKISKNCPKNRKDKQIHEYKVDANFFMKNQTPESSYILG